MAYRQQGCAFAGSWFWHRLLPVGSCFIAALQEFTGALGTVHSTPLCRVSLAMSLPRSITRQCHSTKNMRCNVKIYLNRRKL